jgi:type VI secretion system protein ImpH
MADDSRQPQPRVIEAGAAPEMDFFELLRRLEASGGGARFGRGARPDAEPARLGQSVRLAFAVRDVAALKPADADGPARVTAVLLGLLGPEGPMPLHLTRWVLDRLSQRWFSGAAEGATSDTTFVDFANMVQHRMLALYYRAWADQRPEVQAERPDGGGIGAMLRALAGDADAALGPVKLGQASALGHQVLGPERLTGLLSGALGVPVTVREFVGSWTAIPPRLQTRLGRAHAGLGSSAALGPRAFGRQTRIVVRVGPLPLADYLGFLPGGPRLAALRRALLHAIGEALDVDVQPVLRRDAVSPARLGAARLGRTGWLAPRGDRDGDDLRLRAAVGLAADGPRAAA